MTNRKIIAVSIEPRRLEQLDHYAALLGVSRSRAIAMLIIACTPSLECKELGASAAIRDMDTVEELKAWAAHNGWEDNPDEGD